MPQQYTYPGVYIEEIPSGVHTITGVATSITAFVGRALRGPVDTSVTINSYADFERIYGGLWVESTMSYAVRDFFLNGGSQAIIVRLYTKDGTNNDIARITVAGITLEAASPGSWGNNLRVIIDTDVRQDVVSQMSQVFPGLELKHFFNLTVQEIRTTIVNPTDLSKNRISILNQERFLNITLVPSPRRIDKVLLEESDLVRWSSSNTLDLSRITVVSPSPAGLANIAQSSQALQQAQQSQLAAKTGQPPVKLKDKLLDALKAANEQAQQALADAQGAYQAASDAHQAALDAQKAITDPTKQAAEKTIADAAVTQTQDAMTKASDAQQKASDAAQKAKDDLATAEKQLATINDFGTSVAPPDPQALATAVASKQTALTAINTATVAPADQASDGAVLGTDAFLPLDGEADKTGLYALEQADLFNLLCIPPYSQEMDIDESVISAAIAYCEQRRAMFIADPPLNWTSKDRAKNSFLNDGLFDPSRNAAIFFPRLIQPNQLRNNQMENFAPCGAIAGVFARTDAERGVWKAPAGIDAVLKGTPKLSVSLTDAENGELNQLGVNCLRAFPVYGRVVWGARTLRGADQLADDYKYIPVRRLALFIEESLYRGLQWVVFEPNDEPLWAQIRLNVGAFMQNLFLQGAFQGQTPTDAYLVKCDKETTTQNDINLGIVNIIVAFAPLKPAEFVVIQLQQLTGQIAV